METNENRNEKRHCCGRKRPRAGWIILGIIGFTAFAFLFGAVVMWLWNWLMPVIFHLGVITYCQALGLAILGRLLFGSFHHGGSGHRGPWKHRFHRHDGKNCRDDVNGAKWSHYERYWDEEGERVFNEYVQRQGAGTAKE